MQQHDAHLALEGGVYRAREPRVGECTGAHDHEQAHRFAGSELEVQLAGRLVAVREHKLEVPDHALEQGGQLVAQVAAAVQHDASAAVTRAPELKAAAFDLARHPHLAGVASCAGTHALRQFRQQHLLHNLLQANQLVVVEPHPVDGGPARAPHCREVAHSLARVKRALGALGALAVVRLHMHRATDIAGAAGQKLLQWQPTVHVLGRLPYEDDAVLTGHAHLLAPLPCRTRRVSVVAVFAVHEQCVADCF